MNQAVATSLLVERRGFAHFKRLLTCIRFDEVFLLQGTPLLGALFSMGRPSGEKAVSVTVLLASSICLVAHVFVLNDWSGISGDLRDPNRASRVFLNRGIDRNEVAYLWTALLALSLLLLTPFGLRTEMIALALAGVSALYSAPVFHVKGVPFFSSLLHLVGGILHFLLGYSLFSGVDNRALGIGGFFALIFAAGHLTHEARDRESDLLNGIKTNAVTFGTAPNLVASLILFTVAHGLLALLALCNAIPRPLLLIAALYPLHFWWSLQTLRGGLYFQSIWRLQVRYRVLYAVVGVMMIVGVLFVR